MGLFDFLFTDSSMGGMNGMSSSLMPQPSTAEILFKLASLLGPLAPFIGGTRTPLGRTLGASSALAGGVGNVFSDLLEAQRKDPMAMQLALNKKIAQAAQGITVPVPGTPEQNVPLRPIAAEDFGAQEEGTQPPTLTIPATPGTTRRAENPAELLANARSPEEAALLMLGKPEWLVNEPKYAVSGNRVIQTNAPGGPRITSTLPETPLQTAQLEETKAQTKERLAKVAEQERKTAQQAAMATYLSKQLQVGVANGSVREESAVMALAEVGKGKYTAAMKLISPAVPVPLWDAAMSGKPLTQDQKKSLNNLDDPDRNKVIDVWQSARHANQSATVTAEGNRIAAERNKLTVLPGVFANKTTGEVMQITKGDHEANPKNYKRISAQEAMTVDLLRTSFPMMDRMTELVPKVLAKYPSQQLGTLMKNYAVGKYGSDPDLQELSSLGASLSIEQARALSGSSRVLGSIFAEVKGQIVPGIRVTADTAIRQLKVGRREMENRVNSITGGEIKPFESLGAPPRTPGAPQQSPSVQQWRRNPQTGQPEPVP